MKSLFASKTFWINALTLVLAVLQGQGGLPASVQGVADAHPAGVLGALGAANILLRSITSQPVSLTGEK